MFGGYSPRASPRVRWSLGAGCQLPTETKPFDNNGHHIFFSGTYVSSVKLYNNYAIQYTQSLISQDTKRFLVGDIELLPDLSCSPFKCYCMFGATFVDSDWTTGCLRRESPTVIWSAWRQLHSILLLATSLSQGSLN
jgi:hypothetical protein